MFIDILVKVLIKIDAFFTIMLKTTGSFKALIISWINNNKVAGNIKLVLRFIILAKSKIYQKPEV